jgi:phosphoribosyl 1,2-cyclic phosphate phosphodiesterase
LIIRVLGSGTSGGIPMIGCNCPVCASTDSRDKRLRSSILIETPEFNYAIDAGPDFRQQMLRENVKKLEAIVFTHPHRDHTAGLDDIRAFNFFQKKPMDLYLTEAVEVSLKKEYHYIFEGGWYPGLPEIRFFNISNRPFYINETKFIPIEVQHYKMPVFGYRINNFTYITDANAISQEEKQKIIGTKVLIINALRQEPHISHFSLQEALQIIDEVKPEMAYLTHISHQMGLHAEVEAGLPANVRLAYDGLAIEV